MVGGRPIRGVKGLVTWSYYHAAALLNYTVLRTTDGRWTLAATVVASDSFKLTQRPLLFVAPHATGEWRWPIVDFAIEHGRITASLGAPVE